MGLCSKKNCRANQVRELEAGCSRHHWRSMESVVVPRGQRHVYIFKVRFSAYLVVIIVLRCGWLIGLVDWCRWMISLVPGVRRSVCEGFWPFASVFPLERWWWTWGVETRRILLIICVV
jgi:hypothetical protein